jgi:hypothetical protein
LNQDCAFALGHESMLLADAAKILFRRYRPLADMGGKVRRTRRFGISVESSGQSGLAPENFRTLAHFAVSSAMSLPKSAGEPEAANRRAGLHLGIGESRVHFLIELHDFGGCVLGCANSVPCARLVTWHELSTVGMSGSATERVRAEAKRPAPPSEEAMRETCSLKPE